MNFECLQENLSKSLGVVVRAVPTKGALPVLSNVLINAAHGKVTLTVTNLETVITSTFPALVEKEGSTTVPAKMFNEYISNLNPGKLIISSERNILSVVSLPKTKTKFNGMSSIEFPEIPTPNNSKSYLEINPKILSSLVSHTSFSSSVDVTRPVLTGTLIDFTDGILSFVTTDGFRLSENTHNIEGEFSNFKVVVPTKTLQDVSKIFSNIDENISLIFNSDDNLVFFQGNNISVGVRVIDGTFPDYKRIIPSSKSISVTFKGNDLKEAVRLTSIFSKESNSSIKIEITDIGTLRVFTSSEESGEHVSEFEAVIDGNPLIISFNSKYLNDFLNNIKADEIFFESNGGVTPVVFKSNELNNFLHIIMPMKL
jgi:DNA polymerase-3 subunit beta